jgi:Zn-dependent peptidase ImmA (M78 family)
MLSNRHLEPAHLRGVGLSVAPEQLVASDSNVSFEDLVALGRLFSKPWSFFLVDEPEVFTSAGQDNRSIGNRREPPSPSLLEVIDTVANMLDAASELFPDVKYEVPSDPITPDTPFENAGLAIREFLGMTDEHQLGFRDDFEALRAWGEALQARGVYVSQRRLHDPTIRAFSRVVGDQAIVVVDTGDIPVARIFSLIHEYCHVVLRSTGICDLSDHSAIERYCNAVTGATLLPVRLLTATQGDRRFDRSPEEDDELLKGLSRRLGVSQAAILIRLRDLGDLSQENFDLIETRRAARRGDTDRAPGGQYYPVQINRVGRRFARNVLEALDDHQITRQDASALLEIGEHNLTTYRTEVEKADDRR